MSKLGHSLTVLRGIVAVVAVLVLVLSGPVQVLAQGHWGLGPYQMLNGPSSGPLRAKAGPSALSSHKFLSTVGGVAFSAIATAGPGLREKELKLHYEAANPDGRRLMLEAAGIRYPQDIPDWLLIPTALFADSEYDACVSLFGPNTTPEFYDIVYHEAFENTLLGMRLLQADMMLFDVHETWRLPSLNGEVILGLGELPQTEPDAAAVNDLQRALRGARFRSWLLTDQGEEITVDLADGRLRFSGRPYYYFWIEADASSFGRRQTEVRAQFEQVRSQINSRIAEHNRIASQLNSGAAGLDRATLRSRLQQLKDEIEPLKKRADELKAEHEGLEPSVVEVTDLTSRLKESRDDLLKFNPAVFGAAQQASRLAAFFRFVKSTDPSSWKLFVQSLNGKTPSPRVQTPSKWHQP